MKRAKEKGDGPPSPAPGQGGLGAQMYAATGKRAAKASLPVTSDGAASEETPRRSSLPLLTGFLLLPDSATVGQALRACEERRLGGSWLLVTEAGSAHRVCSLGSLLLYLTGRTPHIVHRLGDCAICSGVFAQVRSQTAALLQEAQADPAICSRLLAELPMAELPDVEVGNLAEDEIHHFLTKSPWRTCAVTQNGRFLGVYIRDQVMAPGGLPDF